MRRTVRKFGFKPQKKLFNPCGRSEAQTFNADPLCSISSIVSGVITSIGIHFASCFLLCYKAKPIWEIAVHLAVAGDVYDGAFLCCSFSRRLSWMRSWT